MSILKWLFGDYSKKEIKRITPLVERINKLEPEMQALTDDQLKSKTTEFKERLTRGETLDDILPEAFAVLREANVRETRTDAYPNGKRHFDVQLLGGIVLHQGRISEMRTGEGKTQTALLALYLNALDGKGSHLVTVNDYLAQYHASLAEKVLSRLGMTVGCIYPGSKNRREAYACDVTYATNNELGFDYLRDNMARHPSQLVQRELHFAIIDEVDSILIDEARTPLIISGVADPSRNSQKRKFRDMRRRQLFQDVQKFVKAEMRERGEVIEDENSIPMQRKDIEETGDYIVDEKKKTVTMTARGLKKAEKWFNLVLDDEDFENPNEEEVERTKKYMHLIDNALKANFNMTEGVDYVKQDGKIIIIDTFTGRLMHGRRFGDDLHEAIEAKEDVKQQEKMKTVATITFQNFFNRYAKKAGMTGTALTEENEFREIYGMDVVAIPTNKEVKREDHPDRVFQTLNAKYTAIVRDILETHQKGQPLLVGTISVEVSEGLHKVLKGEKNELYRVPDESGQLTKTVKIDDELYKYIRDNPIKNDKLNVLNAINHRHEAAIIAEAGKEGMVTIATNMAGRGTDIMLGEGMTAKGGLKVIGTERHESRRIDNQLRGRSGRQGDPGESRFYLSFEDDLLRIFGGDRFKRAMAFAGADADDEIELRLFSRAIENAQKKVEANNFGSRKHVREYDMVMNKQREIIYGERRKILDEYKKIEDKFNALFNAQFLYNNAQNYSNLLKILNLKNSLETADSKAVLEYLLEAAATQYFGGDHPDKLDINGLNNNEVIKTVFGGLDKLSKWEQLTREEIFALLLSQGEVAFGEKREEINKIITDRLTDFLQTNIGAFLLPVITNALNAYVGNNDFPSDWNVPKINADKNLNLIFNSKIIQVIDSSSSKAKRQTTQEPAVFSIETGSQEWNAFTKPQLINTLTAEAVKIYGKAQKTKTKIPDDLLNIITETLNQNYKTFMLNTLKKEVTEINKDSAFTEIETKYANDTALLTETAHKLLSDDFRKAAEALMKPVIAYIVKNTPDGGDLNENKDLQIIFRKPVFEYQNANRTDYIFPAADANDTPENLTEKLTAAAVKLYTTHKGYEFTQSWQKIVNDGQYRESDFMRSNILNMLQTFITRNVNKLLNSEEPAEEWNTGALNNDDDLLEVFRKPILKPMRDTDTKTEYVVELTPEQWETLTTEAFAEILFEKAVEIYEQRESMYTPELMRSAECRLTLETIDENWESHIDNMEQVRQGIGLISYAQRDPLVEYQILSHDMFQELIATIQTDTILELFDEKLDKRFESVLQEKERQLYTNLSGMAVNKTVRVERRPGPNEKCRCGSGKKYKQCCKQSDDMKK